MKKTILITGLALAIATTPVMAQMMGGGQMMYQQQQEEQQQSRPYTNYPGMMGGYGYGMGPGMMGGYGQGMGPGMMGYGQGMGPGMMGYGQGMGPGMMGYGQGMGPGMMGYGMHRNMMGGYGYGMGPGMMSGGCGMGPGMMGYYSPEEYEEQFKEYQEFLNETREQRKKLHTLRFDYAEALRNPGTERKDLEKMNEEMERVWKQIHEKKKDAAE